MRPKHPAAIFWRSSRKIISSRGVKNIIYKLWKSLKSEKNMVVVSPNHPRIPGKKKRFISVWGLGLGISINHILSYIHLHLPNGDWASQDTPRCFYREKPPSGHFGTILQTVSLCKKNGASASLRSFSSQASNASSRPHWRCHTNQDVQIQKQLRVSWAFHRIPHVISFKSSWCLNHPLEKYARHNGFIFPKSIESTIFQHQHMW